MKNHHLICSCYSSEHTIRFVYDGEDLYTEVQLIKKPLLKRLVIGLKYILGYQSKYGVWDCTDISKEEAVKLKDFLEEYVK